MKTLNPHTTADSVGHLLTLALAYSLARNQGRNTAAAVRKCARRLRPQVKDAPILMLLNGMAKNPSDRLVSQSAKNITETLEKNP